VDVIENELVGVKKARALEIGEPLEPSLLIMHYTANQSAAGTVSWFQSPVSKVSAHLVVDFDGTITQMVPFNRRAAHAGASRWRGREGCNAFSIGVEVVNPGPLRRRSDGTFVDSNGKTWEGKVVEGQHKNGNSDFRFWAEYAENQLASVREACVAIARAYPIREIVGHDDVAPTRKFDPGPAFPLQMLRSVLAPRDQDGADVYAATAVLNVRSGPGVGHAPVDGSPLAKGQRIQVLEVNGSWWHVRTLDAAVEGWAASHFLQNV
jgi:N-acetylmuramoyl-L-alanine amidase